MQPLCTYLFKIHKGYRKAHFVMNENALNFCITLLPDPVPGASETFDNCLLIE